MSRFLAMPTAAAAIERIDPTPEPEPEPAPAPAPAPPPRPPPPPPRAPEIDDDSGFDLRKR